MHPHSSAPDLNAFDGATQVYNYPALPQNQGIAPTGGNFAGFQPGDNRTQNGMMEQIAEQATRANVPTPSGPYSAKIPGTIPTNSGPQSAKFPGIIPGNSGPYSAKIPGAIPTNSGPYSAKIPGAIPSNSGPQSAKIPGTTPPITPPQADPFLEAIMRQAQMGIFAMPDKDPGEKPS